MLEVDCSPKESNKSSHSASELSSFDLMRDSSLDRLNGAGDVQYKEPQTTLLAGSTSIHKRHGSTGIYDILGRTSHEEPLARGTLNSTARTISPAQTQLR